MKRNNLVMTAFILVSLAQLFVPYQMISKQAGFAEKGTEFKFKTTAKSGSGISRSASSIAGKYILLNLEESHIPISDRKEWESLQNAYVAFTTDSGGFAKIKSVTKVKPVAGTDWIRARVWLNWKDSTTLHLTYPFNNFYFEDTRHNKIDSILKNGLNDSLKISYLKVKIRENQYISGDLMINGVPFKAMAGKSK